MSVLAPADDALVVGGTQGRVDVLGAVPEREAVRLGQKLEVAIGLGPDGLVGDEGPADLDVPPGAEARADIAPRHDHDAVPVEVHVAPADIEPGARGVDGQVAVLDHQDARPLDRAVESQAREGRRGVELAAEVDELGVSRRAQVDRLPYRRIAWAPTAGRREDRSAWRAHGAGQDQRAGQAALNDRRGRGGRQIGRAWWR